MPTITISVPDEMKKLLDKHKHAFNVSQVCQQALDRELSIHAAMGKKGQRTMLQRLKTEAETERDGVRALGRQEGLQWAQEYGSWDELRMMKRVHDGDRSEAEDWDDVRGAIQDTNEYEGAKSRMFVDAWEEGFLDGAVEAFEQALEEIN